MSLYINISRRLNTIPYRTDTNNPITKLLLTYRILRSLSYIGDLKFGRSLPLKRFVNEFSRKNITFMDPLKESKNVIDYIKGRIRLIRKGDYRHYRKLPKDILYLIRCEAMLQYDFKYDPRIYKLYKHMKHKENHIIHKAIKLRSKRDFSEKEALNFCNEIELYINEFENKNLNKFSRKLNSTHF